VTPNQTRVSAADAAAVLAMTIQAAVALWLWGGGGHPIPLHFGRAGVAWQASGEAADLTAYIAVLSGLGFGVFKTIEQRGAPRVSPAAMTLAKWAVTMIPMARALMLFAAAVSG
jgi:hypothetical protein